MRILTLWQTTIHFNRSIMGSSSSKSMKISSREGTENKDDFVEGVVCKESDIKENEMKAFELGEAGKVLIVKQNGKISAIGAKCTHYGAPLEKGALGDGRVRCPFHGACFNITNGDIEDYPGLDSLPCFQVEIKKDGGVKVRARKEDVTSSRRIRPMVSKCRAELSTNVIVGGGPAGACCAETLRQEGFKGRIVLVCKEPSLPYDRIKLSKLLDIKVEKVLLRPCEFYKEHDIEVLTGTEVVNLDTSLQVVKLSSGCDIKYTNIFLCTGSNPRRPPIPGADLRNVYVLRTIIEANSISDQLTSETNVVVLGSSFIGMEVATFCVGKAKSVTVIGRDAVPFRPVLGEEIGARILKFFKEKGVEFKMNSGIESIIASSSEADKVGEVKLTTGESLPADIVVLGVGATPATGFLEPSGIKLDQQGYVIVNNFLETNLKGVFAGGDIAFAPVLQTHASIGHWGLAHYHGRIAALNMAGKKTELKSVPFFWTMLFGVGIRYAGYAPKFSEIVIGGSVEDMKFVAHYIQDCRVAAVATINWDPAAAKYAELLSSGNQICLQDLQPDPLAWLS